MGSRTSAETLNPLPPDPARHQLSAIPLEDGVTPSAPLIGSGGVERRIAAPGQGVSAQLPRHGGFGPPHRLGDGADRTASGLQRSDLISFVIQQMRIAWHGNTPEGLDQRVE